ncbi:MAG: c-type cytochrome [Bdellovibrio bacteriovorus]
MSQHSSMNFGNSVSGLIAVALLVALVYGLTAGRFGGDHTAAPEVVASRVAPIGTVNTDAKAVAAAPAAPASAGDPGAATYNRLCQACHATGAAGAPLFGNKEAWEPRIAQGKDNLLQSVINGKGAMPPRGTCGDCSDDDLKAAIEYMISKVQ